MSNLSNDPTIPLATTLSTGPVASILRDVHAASDDTEEVYFSGPAPLRGQLGTVLLMSLIGLVTLAIAIALVAKLSAPWWIIPLALLVAACLLLYPVLTTRMQRFKITNYRIDYERGLLSTTIDTIELWHVEDVVMHQSLWDKILKVGTIIVKSHDATLPILYITGLPDPRGLFEILKQRIISVKRSRGVIKMDPG